MRRSTIALALALLVLGLGTQGASAATWRFVAPGGSDAGNNCEDQYARCATIQHAIDEAGAGDSVIVVAGVYAESLTIDKPLSLSSQSGVPRYPYEPETKIDGGSDAAIGIEASHVSVSGFNIATAGTAPAILVSGINNDKLAIEENAVSGGSAGVQLENGGDEDLIGYNVIEGTGDGIRLSGAKYTDLEIKWNEFVAPIDEHTILADSAGTIEGFRLEGNKMSAPTRIAARVKEGPNEESGIYENSFESTVGPQLAVDAAQIRIMRNRFDGHGSAGCLQVLGSQGGLVPSEHVLVSIENKFVDCDPYGIELGPDVNDVSIYDAEFPGTYDGILVSGASPWNVTGRVRVEGNRIVGTTHLGLVNHASGALEAQRNWWGCNAGPGGSGCDTVSAGVDTSDPVRLEALIGPRTEEDGLIELPTGTSIELNPGEEAEVAAVLTSDGSGIILGIPTEGVPVGFFSTAGTLISDTSSLQNGYTFDYFTAGSTPGQGSIVVSMDNQHTIVPVMVCCKAAETPARPPPQPAPKLPAPNLVVPHKRILFAGRSATVGLVSCTSICQVATGHVLTVIGGRRYRATVALNGTPGAESTVPIRVVLSGAAVRALRKLGKGSVKVAVSVTDSTGQTAKRTISVILDA